LPIGNEALGFLKGFKVNFTYLSFHFILFIDWRL
jgi:hypothetical protein